MSRDTGTLVVEAFAGGDSAGVTAALADDAVFRSPAADYHGRERFAPVLKALLAGVVTGVARVSLHARTGETVAFFAATVEGREVDGVLRVVAAADAPATELTLMIRPLEALLAGVKAMQRALEGGGAGRRS
jgi:hypothetical protein